MENTCIEERIRSYALELAKKLKSQINDRMAGNPPRAPKPNLYPKTPKPPEDQAPTAPAAAAPTQPAQEI